MFGDTPTDKIPYCYGIYQPLFDQMKKDVPNLSFHHGLPDVEDIGPYSRKMFKPYFRLCVYVPA